MAHRLDGAHRTRSRHTPGTERDLWRSDDTEAIRGPTESRPATLDDFADAFGYQPDPPRTNQEQDFQETLDQIAEIAEVVIPLYRKHVQPFVKEKVAEVAEWHRSKAEKPGRRYVETQPALPAEPAVAATPAGADPAVAEPTIVLTRDQFQQQVLLTLAAQRWLDQRKEALSRADVVDDDLTPQLRSAINLVLAGKADQLDSEVAMLLAAYFREALAVVAEEQALPVTAQPQNVLLPTSGDTQT